MTGNPTTLGAGAPPSTSVPPAAEHRGEAGSSTPWVWYQREGELWRGGILKAMGYSGAGEGKNNPALQFVHEVGPIPCGAWRIVGIPQDTETHGPYVLRLEPELGTETHGRSGFLIHGDSIAKPGTASHGCIILPHWARAMVWVSGERRITVEPVNPAAEEAA